MIATLLEKEARQHGSMIVLFWILIGVGWFLLESNELLSSVGGSDFYLIAWMLMVLFPLACLVLGNALIATEFRQKTQVFLDGLPMPRWKMVAVKYGCGLGVALVTATMPLMLAAMRIWDQEAMNASFMTMLLVKTSLWAWFCWATIFPFSLLGRYRMIVGLTVVLGLMFLQSLGNVPVHRFGPFELIGDQFAYERVEYPTQAIGITIGLIVLLTIIGFVLSLARDATLATMLSEKMSNREKLVMVGLGITGLMIGGSLAERAEKTDPLDLPDSIDLLEDGVSVSIAAAVAQPTQAEREAMQQHAQSLVGLIRQVGDFLQVEKLPPLFLIHRRDLDVAEFQDGELDSRQGCLVRLNVLETNSTSSALHSHVIAKLLDANQHKRLSSDSRGWILEGFAYWWPRREPQPAASDSAATPTVIENTKRPPQTEIALTDFAHITAEDIVRWKSFRQRLPEGKADWFAAQLIAALWERDPGACTRFLSITLGYSAPHDVRATVHDWWFNVPSLVRQWFQMDLEQLATFWNSVLPSSQEPAKS